MLTPKHFLSIRPSELARYATVSARNWFLINLMVPDPRNLSRTGAVLPWRRGGKRMITYYKSMLRGVAAHYRQSSGSALCRFARGLQESSDLGLRRDGNRISLLARRQDEYSHASL